MRFFVISLAYIKKKQYLCSGILIIYCGIINFIHRIHAEKERLLRSVGTSAESYDRHHTLADVVDGFEGNLTTQKYAKINHCSQDTALRDIQSLIEKHILRKTNEGGRSTHYELIG